MWPERERAAAASGPVRFSRAAAFVVGCVIALPFVLASALRGGTRDTLLYIEIFRSTHSFPLDPMAYYAEHGVEWGYGVLSWLVNGVGAGPVLLFALISSATFLFLGLAARVLGISLGDILPYYLSTFFLTQQFMQIRQGLAVAVAFYFVALLVQARHRALLAGAGVLVTSLAHLVAPLPVLAAALGLRLVERLKPVGVLLLAALAVVLTLLACRQVASIEILSDFEKLSQYTTDQEFGAARSVFEPANVRAGLLLALFGAAYPWMSRTALAGSFRVLLLLYAVHFGIRLGFLEVQILSGRLSTVFGFAEVFLLALLIKSTVQSPVLRWLLALSYFLVHCFLTLSVQVPFLLDDYFTAIHRPAA